MSSFRPRARTSNCQSFIDSPRWGPCPIYESSGQNSRTDNKDVIAPDLKFAVKELVAKELLALVEESQDDILSTSSDPLQSSIPWDVGFLLEQAIFGLPHKDMIGEMLYAHIGKFFKTNTAI